MIEKAVTLLLCAALISGNTAITANATASVSLNEETAVALSDETEENTSGNEETEEETSSEGTETETETETEGSSEGTGTTEEETILPDEDETESSEESGEETLTDEDETMTEETLEESTEETIEEVDGKDKKDAEEAAKAMKEFMDERMEALNKIIDERVIMALLYLEDTYPLREGPSEDAAVIRDIECGSTLYIQSAVYEDEKLWFYVSADSADGMTDGYIPYEMCICVDERFLAWEESLKEAPSAGDREIDLLGGTDTIPAKAKESLYSFPDRYRDELEEILKKHNNWVFVPQKVGSTLSEVLDEELSVKERNLVYSTLDDSYKNGHYDGNWYYASRNGLKYYMDPENFIGSESKIFMFEQLTYNASYHTLEGVQNVLSSTFMKGEIPSEGMTYSQAFYEIGSSLGVSPYHLASRVYLEQNPGTSPLISGTYTGYEGYYNYFNIGASGKGDEQYKNGLSYAKGKDWNTRYKSLRGGAEFDSKYYIMAGQDTLYLEKYNIVKKEYGHQYMQSISAPSAEASKVYEMYNTSGALSNAFVFKIPVFNGETISPNPWDDPEETAALDALGTGTPKLYAITNITTKLSQISLEKLSVPETITSVKWKTPDKVLKAAEGKEIQYFTVQFRKTASEPYEVDVPVYVTKLNSFTIKDITTQTEGIDYLKPDDVIQGSRKTIYEVTSSLTGYTPGSLGDIGLTVDFSISGKLKDGTQPVETRTISSENGRWVIELKVPDTEIPNLTDKSVGQLKITAAFVNNADNKKYASTSHTMTMTILDTDPVLTPSKVTLNIWKKTGAPISLTAQNGNNIKDVKLLYKGEISDILEVKKIDGVWTVQFIDYEVRQTLQQKNKGFTQKLTMQIETDQKIVEKAFTVQAVNSKPKVTLTTIRKPNLFISGSDGYGEYAINSSEEIEYEYTWLDIPEDDEGYNKARLSGRPVYGVHQFLHYPDPEYTIFYLDHRGVTPDNYRKMYTKCKLRIKFKDYDRIVYSFNFPYTYAKPSIKSMDKTGYLKGDTAHIWINTTLVTNKITISVDDPHVTGIEIPNYCEDRLYQFDIKTDEEFKEGKKKIILESDDWIAPVTFTVNITKKAPVMRLLYGNTATLSTAVESTYIRYNNGIYIPGYQQYSHYYEIDEIAPLNAAAAKLVDTGYLDIEVNPTNFWFWLDKSKRGDVKDGTYIKAGTYKFEVRAHLNDADNTPLKPVKLTVRIVDKDPAKLTTLKSKGSINLVNRENTYIRYIPTFKDLQTKVIGESGVTLTGESAGNFHVKYYRKGYKLPGGRTVKSESGEILLYANSGAPLDTGKNYKMNLEITLENRVKIVKTITVKPKQTPAKTTGSVSKTTVPLNGDAVYFTIRSSGKTADDSIIESVELVADKNGTFFTYTPAASAGTTGTYIGTIKVNNTIKKTGSYKLTFNVKYKDHAGNVAAKKIYLTAKVK